MWFKNIQLFHLEEDVNFSAAELNTKLLQSKLGDCGQLEKFNFGWCNPIGDDAEDFCAHVYKDCFLIALGKNERLLPQSVVRETVTERVKAIKKEEARDVFSKEKANLRDEVTFELLPKAFTKKTRLYAYIDKKNKWLIVDTSSHKKAEELTSFLRDTLGSLKLSSVDLPNSPHSKMSNWLLEHRCPTPFVIEDSCELFDIKTGVGSVKCTQQDLSSTEVSNHIRAGKQVVSLAMSWSDKLYFTLSDDFSIKRIKPLDIIEERLKDELIENDYEKQSADFAMMTTEFSELLTQLFSLFGAEVDSPEPEVVA